MTRQEFENIEYTKQLKLLRDFIFQVATKETEKEFLEFAKNALKK